MRTLLNRRQAALALGAVAATPGFAKAAPVDWHALGEDVKNEMRWAWSNYHERAWGKADF